MSALSSFSDTELFERLVFAVHTERAASAEVIFHLVEVERRELFAKQACGSLYKYCIERLGYSEDGAVKRARVADLAKRLPQVLDELRTGAIHLTGLFLLSKHLTEDNAEALLAEARGKSRKQIEKLIAQWFPRPDVATTVTPIPPATAADLFGCPRPGDSPHSPERPRVEPLSATSYRLELTISAELHEKIEHLRDLMSHAVPNRDLAALLERAIDHLLERETKRRMGAGKPRKRREQKPGSRHIPVEVQAAVRARDGHQCSFVDAQGRRCTEKAFLTLEHIVPYAQGGLATKENVCLFCQKHNHFSAVHAYGKAHIEKKIVFERVLSALVQMGFRRKQAAGALARVETEDVEPAIEPVMRAALAVLTSGSAKSN